MKKCKLLLLVTLNIITFHIHPMKPKKIPVYWYHSRKVTLLNKLEKTIIVRYQLPDVGFGGPGILRSTQVIMASGQETWLTIVKNKDGSASIDITAAGSQQKELGTKNIPKEVELFNIRDDDHS